MQPGRGRGHLQVHLGEALKRVLLIDGDIVAYQVAASTEKAIDWGEGVHSIYADEDEGKANVDNWLAELRTELKADKLDICLSDTRNFRKEVLSTYKSNRANTRPPMIRRILEQHLVDNHGARRKPGLEADDMLGILQTNPKLHAGCEKIIVSIDKDLLTIPGKVFNWKKQARGMVEVTLPEADRYHLVQTLMGDATDGYSGCPGIGPKRANAILDEAAEIGPEALWPAIVKAFAKAKLGEEEALVQARVARILRHEDFNYRTQEPILWTPPSP